jgi:hypothetical protein
MRVVDDVDNVSQDIFALGGVDPCTHQYATPAITKGR